MRDIGLRLLGLVLLAFGIGAFSPIRASFALYSGLDVIGMFLSNVASCYGALFFLWRPNAQVFAIWLMGYAPVTVALLLLPPAHPAAPDEPWIWIALPILSSLMAYYGLRRSASPSHE